MSAYLQPTSKPKHFKSVWVTLLGVVFLILVGLFGKEQESDSKSLLSPQSDSLLLESFQASSGYAQPSTSLASIRLEQQPSILEESTVEADLDSEDEEGIRFSKNRLIFLFSLRTTKLLVHNDSPLNGVDQRAYFARGPPPFAMQS